MSEETIGREVRSAPVKRERPSGDEGWFVDLKWYDGLRYTLGTLMGLYFRIRVGGLRHIPASGPAVLISNHQSWLDPLLLAKPVPRPIAFMAKHEMFRVPLIGHIAREVGAFPVDREARDPRSIKLALQVLRDGQLLGMFPEGTRSRTGALGPFRSGALRLAERVRAPIVPACVVGSGRLLPHGSLFPRPGVVYVRYGRPIDLATRYGPRLTEAQRAELLQEVRGAIEALMRGA